MPHGGEAFSKRHLTITPSEQCPVVHLGCPSASSVVMMEAAGVLSEACKPASRLVPSQRLLTSILAVSRAGCTSPLGSHFGPAWGKGPRHGVSHRMSRATTGHPLPAIARSLAPPCLMTFQARGQRNVGLSKPEGTRVQHEVSCDMCAQLALERVLTNQVSTEWGGRNDAGDVDRVPLRERRQRRVSDIRESNWVEDIALAHSSRRSADWGAAKFARHLPSVVELGQNMVGTPERLLCMHQPLCGDVGQEHGPGGRRTSRQRTTKSFKTLGGEYEEAGVDSISDRARGSVAAKCRERSVVRPADPCEAAAFRRPCIGSLPL